MTRSLLTILFILLSFSSNGQTKNQKALKMSQYAGVYQYGTTPENGPTGQITVYPESNNMYLFYVDISRGAPSYNMGNLYGRITINHNKGTYSFKDAENDLSCSFSFTFIGNKLIVKTINSKYDCGFGGNVFVDGEYKKVKNAKFDYFIDITGKKYYFKKTKPEEYAKILK